MVSDVVSRGENGETPVTPPVDSRTLTAMPERPDRVTIPLSRGDIVLTWDSRESVLEQLKHLDTCQPIRDAFDAVGGTRPVELRREQKITLFQIIEFWANETSGGYDGLPDVIYELRNALHDDLHDTRDRD